MELLLFSPFKNALYFMLLFQEHGELEFRRGDVITVTDKSDQVSKKNPWKFFAKNLLK